MQLEKMVECQLLLKSPLMVSQVFLLPTYCADEQQLREPVYNWQESTKMLEDGYLFRWELRFLLAPTIAIRWRRDSMAEKGSTIRFDKCFSS